MYRLAGLAPAIASVLMLSAQVRQMPPPERRWAVVVGANQYEVAPKPQYASSDAQSLSEAFVDRMEFPEMHVALLTSEHPDKRSQPTKLGISQHLGILARQMQPDSLLVFSFSGHGLQAGREAYIMPSDAQDLKTGISISELVELLRATKAREIIAFLDVCRNEDEKAAAGEGPTEQYGLAFDIDPFGISAFATFNAARANESAYENARSGHSFFAQALIEALTGAPEAMNCRREVTISSLQAYLQHAVSDRVRHTFQVSQRPWVLTRGFAANDLVLVPRKDPPCPAGAAFNSRDGLCYSLVNAGRVLGGCPSDCGLNDRPRHEISIATPFYITQTEVTVSAYRAYAFRNNRGMPPPKYVNPDWDDGRKPMVNLKWEEAAAYCRDIGGALPSEEQWEFAARGGVSDTQYYWGDAPSPRFANYLDVRQNGSLHRVAEYPPNAFGIFDLLGNAAEWVASENDPEERVVRGGSWRDPATGIRLFSRIRRDRLFSGPEVGFRCVLMQAPPALPVCDEPFCDVPAWK